MSIAPATPTRSARIKHDSVLASAVELARSVAVEEAEQLGHVGAHLGVVMIGERLAAHTFACEMRGYVGWQWTVTLARVPRGRVATVCEVHLLPTSEAILAPQWLPWAERLAPGDIGPGDVLPFKSDDARLVPGYTATGDEQEDQVAIEELALARTRILSETGRDEAASRWYGGTQGPWSTGSMQSAGSCGSCGFLVPLQGALGQVFGVCANMWSNDDGKVVALGHGCGAHSETDVPHRASGWPVNNPIIDETSIVEVTAQELASLPPLTRTEPAGSSEGDTTVRGSADGASEAVESAAIDGAGNEHVAAAGDNAEEPAALSAPTAEQSEATELAANIAQADAGGEPSTRRKNTRSRGRKRAKDRAARQQEQSTREHGSADDNAATALPEGGSVHTTVQDAGSVTSAHVDQSTQGRSHKGSTHANASHGTSAHHGQNVDSAQSGAHAAHGQEHDSSDHDSSGGGTLGALDLPTPIPASERNHPSREEALHSLDMIAASLPQRGTSER